MLRKYFSALAGAGFRLLGLLLVCSSVNSYAGDLLVDCRTATSGSLECRVDSAPTAVVPDALKGLILSVVDSMDGEITEQLNTCDTGFTTCYLVDPVTEDSIDLQCQPDAATQGAVTCRHYMPNSTQALLRLDCYPSSDGTYTRCAFKADKENMAGMMSGDETFNINEAGMMKGMMACLSNLNQEALCMKMMWVMMNGTADQKSKLASFMRKLTPRKPDVTMDVSTQSLRMATQVIKQRLGHLRSGRVSSTLNTQFFDGRQWHRAGTLLAQASDSQADVSPEPSLNIRNLSPWGLFINGTVIRSEQDASELEGSHKGDTQVLTIGSDYRFNEHWFAGAAYNLTSAQTDYSSNSGELDTFSHALMLYGSYADGNWYVDASLSYSADRYEQARNVSCSVDDCGAVLAFEQTFSADFDGRQVALNLATGYNWQWQRWTVTPAVQATQARLETDTYQEQASSAGTGSGYALNMDEAKRDLTTLAAGVNIQYAVTSQRGVFIPSVGIKAVQELDDDVQVISGRFIGNIATDDAFALVTNEVDTHYLLLSAGVNFQLKNGNAGFINLQRMESYDYLKQTQVTAGWRWEF